MDEVSVGKVKNKACCRLCGESWFLADWMVEQINWGRGWECPTCRRKLRAIGRS